MTTLYVKAVDENSWSRTAWDDTGATDYVVGDRVTTTVGDGGTYDALLKTYVCIADNNSTTDPGSDPTNWVRAGESKEYPYHAPGGKLDTNQTLGEVFLDNAATRYKSTTNPQASFWWHAQDYTANNAEPANIVFLNGSYSCKPSNGQSIATERLNFEAESHLKVTIDLGDNPSGGAGFFRWNDNVVSTMKDIKFLVAGAKKLFQADTCISFVNCTITDGGSSGDYDSLDLEFGSYGTFSEFKNCLIHLPSASTRIGGFSSLSDGLHPVTGEKMLWENTTFALQWGNSNNYDAWFYNNNYVKVRNCIFYILGFNYTGGSVRIATAGLDVENSIFYAEATSPYWAGSDNDGLIDRNPLFIDGVNGDFRLRPGSPLIGGGESSKFPADAVWMQSGSGTGTGTESDPYYFDQFTDALSAASSSTSKKVVLKDGTYTFSNSHCEDSNINSVTFIAENLHGATISDGNSRKVLSAGIDNTLNIENLTLDGGDHFINVSQSSGKLSLVAKGCKFELAKYIYFKNCDISGCFLNGVGQIMQGDNSGNFLVRNSTLIGTTGPIFNTGVVCKNSILYLSSSSASAPAGTTTGCISYNFAAQDGCIDADPLFIDADNDDYRLRPSSPCIGGITPDDSNVYYLQPGNTYNGDGSQKDASSMTDNGEPGPFNSFTAVKDAAEANNVPYGSKIVIVDGDYSWPSEFNKLYNNTTIDFERFHYHSESPNGVSFDAAKDNDNYFGAQTLNDGVKRDTSFTGITFKNLATNGYGNRGCFSFFGADGYSRVSFNSCSFSNIIQTSEDYCIFGIPQAGGSIGPSVSITNSIVSFAIDGNGGSIFGYYVSPLTNWEIQNNTFVNTSIGESVFNGRNSSDGSYGSTFLFQSQDTSTCLIKNNIFYNNLSGEPSGSTNKISQSDVSNKTADFSNNLFFNIANEDSTGTALIDSSKNFLDIDPLFVDAANSNFSLRPQSPLIGEG